MTNEDENTPADGEDTPPEDTKATDKSAGSAKSGAAKEKAAAAADTDPKGTDSETTEPKVSEAAETSAESVEYKELESDDPAAEAGQLDPQHVASELEPVFDVPVNVQAILGKSNIEVCELLKLGAGSVVELDRKVGEAIDIYVNDRLVARGEVVLVEDHLGVTMTEIIKTDAVQS